MAFGVWNNIDEVAVYLGLDRYGHESDDQLFSRIKRFTKWKYRTDYFTQVHSIPLQTEMDFFDVIKIFHINGDYFECRLDWEYFSIEYGNTFARVFINTKDATLSKITNLLDGLLDIDYVLQEKGSGHFPCKYLLRNKNVSIQTELVTGQSFNLKYSDLKVGSFSSSSTTYCINKKSNIQEITKTGDYFIDYDKGYLQLFEQDPELFNISYTHYESEFMIEGGDMNLIPLNILASYGITDDLIELLPYVLGDQVWGR